MILRVSEMRGNQVNPHFKKIMLKRSCGVQKKIMICVHYTFLFDNGPGMNIIK